MTLSETELQQIDEAVTDAGGTILKGSFVQAGDSLSFDILGGKDEGEAAIEAVASLSFLSGGRVFCPKAGSPQSVVSFKTKGVGQ